MLSSSHKMILKTRDEASGIPTIEANRDCVVAAKYARAKFALDGLHFTSDLIDEEVSFLFGG